MTNPLLTKLSSFTDLEPDDIRVINDLCEDVRDCKAGSDLISQGDRPNFVFLLLEGWAFRYKVLPDGKRQIMAYLLPGDLCDAHIFILKEMDHGLALLNDAKVAFIPKEKMLAAFEHHPHIARAIWWSTLVDEATLREWLVNVGQRDAYHRIAHLIAELMIRLEMVDHVTDGRFEMPITQTDLGDTVGLTSVHVNRILQMLRADGIIQIQRKSIYIPDPERLKEVANFESNYLHLDRRK